MAATRILVVEDEAVVAKDLQQRLRKLGYDVPLTVATGEAAVLEAATLLPQLVLMDVRLKGEIDGIEAASRIHQYLDVPIIFLTAYADSTTVDRAKVIEPFGYILKPFAERELHTAIQVAIYKHQAESNLRRSERWLGATLRSISDAVIAVDGDSNIVFMNAVAEDLTGYTAAEATGGRVEEVFKTAGQARSATRVPLEHREEGDPGILIARDGRQFQIEQRSSPIRDEHGAIAGGVLVFRDIGSRKRAEDALRASEEHFRLLVEGVKDYGIFMLDRQGTVMSWNPGAERIQRYKTDEIVGKPFSSFYTPEDAAADKPKLALEKAAEDGSYQETGWRMRKDGSRFYADVLVTALRNEQGELSGYSKLMRDVTERMESEERFRQTQKLESLGVLAGGVAHDFNNLLTGIIGNCSLALEESPASNPQRKHLEGVIHAAEKAAQLTQQLLSYAGRGDFSSRPINLSRLTSEISSLIITSVPKNVRLELTLAPDLPAVNADASQIQQIIMNLVINAAEASGDREGRVTLQTGVTVFEDSGHHPSRFGDTKAGRYVYLEVRDNGCGMDEATREKIFDPFFTTKFQGRGLGLSAVLGIVRRHEGCLHLESAPGEGTLFRVLFPALDEAAVDIDPPPVPDDLQGSGLVLFVDDEEILRRTGKSCLERYGYEVLLASNGREAMVLFRERANEIDLVLMDLTMPVMNGSEALKQMRAIRAEIPAILSSGYDEKKVQQLSNVPSLTYFIQKPYNAQQLAQKVGAVLSKTRNERPT